MKVAAESDWDLCPSLHFRSRVQIIYQWASANHWSNQQNIYVRIYFPERLNYVKLVKYIPSL